MLDFFFFNTANARVSLALCRTVSRYGVSNPYDPSFKTEFEGGRLHRVAGASIFAVLQQGGDYNCFPSILNIYFFLLQSIDVTRDQYFRE